MRTLSQLMALPMSIDLPRGECALSDCQADLMADWEEYKQTYACAIDGEFVMLPLVIERWREGGYEAIGNMHLANINREQIRKRDDRRENRRGK